MKNILMLHKYHYFRVGAFFNYPVDYFKLNNDIYKINICLEL